MGTSKNVKNESDDISDETKAQIEAGSTAAQTEIDSVPTDEEIEKTRQKMAEKEEVNDAELDAMTDRTRRSIDMKDTVHRFYPSLEGMSPKARMVATINGFEYSCPRNEDVEVPVVFAEIFDRIRKAETGQNIRKDLLHDRPNNIIG